MSAEQHSHYHKDVSHLRKVDVYRVLSLFGVTEPSLQHAIKKLLVAGGRGAGKDIETDVRESIDSLNRFLQMRAEDCNVGTDTTAPVITAAMVSIVRSATDASMAISKRALQQGQGCIELAVELIKNRQVK